MHCSGTDFIYLITWFFLFYIFYLSGRDGKPFPSINIEIEKKESVRVGSGETRATEKDQCMHVDSRETQQEKDINVHVTAR